MTKERKITLNAEKRQVIADQFQSFYEDKVKDKLVQAKEQYDLMREKAKVAIESKIVQFFNEFLFSNTNTQCKRAVKHSQGISETFSTGSQNQKPPHPSS